MILNYKNETKEVKRNTIQEVYNLMNISCKGNVLRLVNNNSVEVMNKDDIKTIINVFQRIL